MARGSTSIPILLSSTKVSLATLAPICEINSPKNMESRAVHFVTTLSIRKYKQRWLPAAGAQDIEYCTGSWRFVGGIIYSNKHRGNTVSNGYILNTIVSLY